MAGSGHHPAQRYEFVHILGAGGFGKVYLARKLGAVKFTCAVKLPGGDPEFLIRLHDEARMLAQLNHPAIVRITDFVRFEQGPALVMEYVDGVTLSAVLKSIRRVPPRAALEIIKKVASALAYAANQTTPTGTPMRLKHRDIKPGNIMLTRFGEVKLLDFGIATAEIEDREALTVGQAPATRGYRSPERLNGEACEAPADIYALGTVLYELLSGDNLGEPAQPVERKPFVEWQEARLQRLQSRAQTLGEQAGLDQTLDLLHRMLDFAPEARVEARDVEEMVDFILSSIPGPSLERWSQAEIPRVPQQIDQTRLDSLTGRVWEAIPAEGRTDWTSGAQRPLAVVQETHTGAEQVAREADPITEPSGRGGSRPAPAPAASMPPPPVPRKRWRYALGGGGGLATLIAALVKLWGGPELDPAEVQPVIDAVAQASNPPPTAPGTGPAPAPSAPTPAPSAPTPAPSAPTPTSDPPAPSASATRTAAKTASPAPAATTARVVLSPRSTGVTSAKLISTTDKKLTFNISDSKIPPGTYTIRLSDGSGFANVDGPLSLDAGDRVTLVCNFDEARCTR